MAAQPAAELDDPFIGRLFHGDTPEDEIDWVETLLTIDAETGRVVKFQLYPQQRMMATHRSGRDITVKGRQTRASSYLLARNLRRMVTHGSLKCLIMTQDDQTTATFRARIKHHLRDLANKGYDFLSAKGLDNENELVLDTGSRYIFGSGEERTAGRAYTAHVVHLSEFAHWPPERTGVLIGGVQPSVPGPPAGWIDIESTPNGAEGTFYEMVMGSKQYDPMSRWTAHFYPWWLEPRYRAGTIEGNDILFPENEWEALLRDFRPTPEEAQLMETVDLDVGQIIWRRIKKKEQDKTDAPFLQEYPETLEGCQPAGELVLMGGTPISIEELKEEDLVLGIDGKDHLVQRTNSRWYEGEMVTLELERLPRVRFTAEHPVYMKRNGASLWLAVTELRSGDKVFSPTPDSDGDTNISWPFSPWLLGLWLAEGSLSGDKAIVCLGLHEQDLAERVKQELGGVIYPIPGQNSLQVRITNRGLVGLLEQFGRGAKQKRLPESYLRQKRGYGLEILRGWLAGDGYLHSVRLKRGEKLSYTGKTTSDQLAWQMWALARRVGLRVSLRRHKGETGGWVWEVDFYDVSAEIVAGRREGYRKPLEQGEWIRVRKVYRQPAAEWVYNLKADGSYVTGGIAASNCFLTAGGSYFASPDGINHLERYRHTVGPPKEIVDSLPFRNGTVSFNGPSLYIWQRPQAGRPYVVWVDCAGGGLGEESDFSAVVVLDAAEHFVAARLAVKVSPQELAPMVVAIASYYNNALLGGERDAFGSVCLNSIQQLYFRNLWYYVEPGAQLKIHQAPQEPWGHPTAIRNHILGALRESVFSGTFHTSDPWMVQQMGAFTWSKVQGREKMKAAGKRGYKDDLVMAAAGCVYIAPLGAARYNANKGHVGPEPQPIRENEVVVVGRYGLVQNRYVPGRGARAPRPWLR